MASMVAASLAVTVAVGAAGDGQRPPGTIRYHRRGRLSGTEVPPPEYTIRTFTQTLDHFNAENSGTFAQRFLVTDKYYHRGTGAPIFAMTGAEGGDVTQFYDFAYGHAVEYARKRGALILFLEHRFFGESLPFRTGSDAPLPNRLGLLSVEQGLADYATIIHSIRDEYEAWDAKVVTFGGSLAGTLAALMRVRYPNLVDIGWASSTPLLGYPDIPGISQYSWRKQITENFEQLSPRCPEIVRNGFAAIQDADSATIRTTFNVCEAEYDGMWSDVQGVAWGVLESDGEFTYPSSTSKIPAHCKAMSEVATDLQIFNALIRVGASEYLEPGSGCLNLTEYKAAGQSADATGWNYLACTEIMHPIGANNITDMFPPYTWSVAGTAGWCAAQFHVTPRPDVIPQEFGLGHIHERFAATHRNILFVYGLMDPWHTLGVGLVNLSLDLPVVVVPDGSHCADMEAAQPADTKTMLAARLREEGILDQWLNLNRANGLSSS